MLHQHKQREARQEVHLLIRISAPPRAGLLPLTAVLSRLRALSLLTLLLLGLSFCPGAAEGSLCLLKVRQRHTLQTKKSERFLICAITLQLFRLTRQI